VSRADTDCSLGPPCPYGEGSRIWRSERWYGGIGARLPHSLAMTRWSCCTVGILTWCTAATLPEWSNNAPGSFYIRQVKLLRTTAVRVGAVAGFIADNRRCRCYSAARAGPPGAL
jgi:hypothetical protein